MKKSELIQMVKEEIKKFINEIDYNPKIDREKMTIKFINNYEAKKIVDQLNKNNSLKNMFTFDKDKTIKFSQYAAFKNAQELLGK